MKANIRCSGNNGAVIELIPESEGERTQIVNLAELTSHGCIANQRGFKYMMHRGFKYMMPGIEIFVQTMPTSGD